MIHAAKLTCQICKEEKRASGGQIAELVRPSLAEFIHKQTPGWDPKGFICFDDLGRFRKEYVKEVLQDEIGELSALDHEVIESLQQHEILSENIGRQFEKRLTFGERLSDRIATFGGSWTFIIIFGVILFLWIAVNTFVLTHRAFDPYPYILMNLILSCLAAMQAPIIMMSQNRGEARDRSRAENDYKINLKAALEISHCTRRSIICCAGNTTASSRFSRSRLSSWKSSAANAAAARQPNGRFLKRFGSGPGRGVQEPRFLL
ncbi:MAG: DUF1003 domain-containing protein [Chthoniobacterales bacterium]